MIPFTQLRSTLLVERGELIRLWTGSHRAQQSKGKGAIPPYTRLGEYNDGGQHAGQTSFTPQNLIREHNGITKFLCGKHALYIKKGVSFSNYLQLSYPGLANNVPGRDGIPIFRGCRAANTLCGPLRLRMEFMQRPGWSTWRAGDGGRCPRPPRGASARWGCGKAAARQGRKYIAEFFEPFGEISVVEE